MTLPRGHAPRRSAQAARTRGDDPSDASRSPSGGQPRTSGVNLCPAPSRPSSMRLPRTMPASPSGPCTSRRGRTSTAPSRPGARDDVCIPFETCIFELFALVRKAPRRARLEMECPPSSVARKSIAKSSPARTSRLRQSPRPSPYSRPFSGRAVRRAPVALFYRAFGDWLLDYDRQRMAAIFEGVVPRRLALEEVRSGRDFEGGRTGFIAEAVQGQATLRTVSSGRSVKSAPV